LTITHSPYWLIPRFEVRQYSRLNLTSHAGLALLGQCFEAALVEPLIDAKIPVSQGMKTPNQVFFGINPPVALVS